MKSTGIIRNIDELGRLVIPKEIRKKMSIQNNAPVEIFVEDDKIIVKKSMDRCIICDGKDGLTEVKGKLVCADCKRELSGE